MRWVLVLAVLTSSLLMSDRLAALNCTPDSITLSSQAEVDSFEADHGAGCDTIVSNLTITGASITNLMPLSNLTSAAFGSHFVIDGTSVTSLAGLENLIDVYWFEIKNNAALTTIGALSNLGAVAGPFFIQANPALTSLDGLGGLTYLSGGVLWLQNNPSLADLSGISGLVSINASLVISNNDALTDLDDLSGLQNVSSSITIQDNDGLGNIGGLSGLVGFKSTLYLRNNSVLTSLGDLSSISVLNGLVISNNDALPNLDGLSGLTALGSGTALSITHNDSLTNINALANVESAQWNVELQNNFALDQCWALQTLLDDVDDGQPGPGPGAAGIPDVGGDVTISGNLSGCNSVAEIVAGGPTGADLSIDVLPEVVDILVEDIVDFDFVVFNGGPEAASNVFVSAVFSGTVVPESLPPECGFASQSNTINCVIVSLGSGSGQALEPQVRFPVGGNQQLEVTVSADQDDPDAGNNQVLVPVFVSGVGGANLAAGGAVLAGTNALGQALAGTTELAMSASAANSGLADATGVTVEVTFPGDWMLTGYEPACSTSTPADLLVLTCPLPDLEAPPLPAIPTDALTQFSVIPHSVGDVTVVVSAHEADPVPGNNSAVIPVDVRLFTANPNVSLDWQSEADDLYLLDDAEFLVKFSAGAYPAEEPVQPYLTIDLSPAEHVTSSSIDNFTGECTEENLGSFVRWTCTSASSSVYWGTGLLLRFKADQAGAYSAKAVIHESAAFDIDVTNNTAETVLTLVPPPPVQVRAIEVNQVVQDWKNSVSLFSGKQTVVRVFTRDEEALSTPMSGRLVGLRGGIPVAGSPLNPISGHARTLVNPLALRDSVTSALNFLLPNNWTNEGNLELVFVLDALGRPEDCAEPDGSPDCRTTVTFTKPVLPELDMLAAGYTTDDVQWLVFDCGQPCVPEPANPEDPPDVVPSGYFRIDVGSRFTGLIDIENLMLEMAPKSRSPLLENALSALPEFEADELVITRLTKKRLADGGFDEDYLGWRISIRKKMDWPNFIISQASLVGATAIIRKRRDGGVYVPPPTLSDLFEQVARLKGTLPLATLNMRYVWISDFDWKPKTSRDINPVVDEYRLLQDAQCPLCRTDDLRVGAYLRGYGVEGSGGNAMNHVYSAYIGGALTSTDPLDYSSFTGPHEFAHTFRKEHAVVRPNPGGSDAVSWDDSMGLCGAIASDVALYHPHVQQISGKENEKLAFPDDYPSDTWPTIGPLDQGDDSEVWGVDIRRVASGIPNWVISPDEVVDMMSYCYTGDGDRKWPSDFTYEQIAAGLVNGWVGTPDDEGAVGDIVFVSGTVEAGEAEVTAVTGVTAHMPDQESGTLRVAFVDETDNELSGVSVRLQLGDGRSDQSDVNSNEDDIPASFSAAIPLPEQTVAALVIGDVGAPLARIEASANAPTVSIISPIAATVLGEEGLTAEWSGFDADGDKLSYSVFYSADGGTTWDILGLNLAEESILLPAERLARSAAGRIKVSVSDGLLFSEAISEPFEVPNNAPFAAIVSLPMDESLQPDNVLHRFASMAWDTEDGSLDDSTAEWYSDKDGLLGIGSPLDVHFSDLSPACHVFTVVYSDSDGATGSASQQACVHELVLRNGFE